MEPANYTQPPEIQGAKKGDRLPFVLLTGPRREKIDLILRRCFCANKTKLIVTLDDLTEEDIPNLIISDIKSKQDYEFARQLNKIFDDEIFGTLHLLTGLKKYSQLRASSFISFNDIERETTMYFNEYKKEMFAKQAKS